MQAVFDSSHDTRRKTGSKSETCLGAFHVQSSLPRLGKSRATPLARWVGFLVVWLVAFVVGSWLPLFGFFGCLFVFGVFMFQPLFSLRLEPALEWCHYIGCKRPSCSIRPQADVSLVVGSHRENLVWCFSRVVFGIEVFTDSPCFWRNFPVLSCCCSLARSIRISKKKKKQFVGLWISSTSWWYKDLLRRKNCFFPAWNCSAWMRFDERTILKRFYISGLMHGHNNM